MAANKYLNQDQYVHAYHWRERKAIPHEDTSPLGVHFGTLGAALSRGKDVTWRGTVDTEDAEGSLRSIGGSLHKYAIPKRLISPVLYGDPELGKKAKYFPNTDVYKRIADPSNPQHRQPELFESVPVPELGQGRKLEVRQYRNAVEDPMSVSYVVPRELLRSGVVKHLGSQFAPDR